MPFNDYNYIPNNNSLGNKALNYLKKKNIDFILSSVSNDIIDTLDCENKKFDVPFNQNWIIKDIGSFDIDAYILKSKKKKRDKLKRSLRLYEKFKVVNVWAVPVFGI